MKISRGLIVTAGLAAIAASIACAGHSGSTVDLGREMQLDPKVASTDLADLAKPAEHTSSMVTRDQDQAHARKVVRPC